MGELTAEAFANWLHASDVIEHLYQRKEPEPGELAISMLCDGLLQAAAAQLIVDGRDLGLTLIPRGLWPVVQWTSVWMTDRFRIDVDGRSISAYDVRIDRDLVELPKANAIAPSGRTTNSRAPSHKSGRGPSDNEVLAKADEMRALGHNTYRIASEMRLEAGFENVATNTVRNLIKGRYPRSGRSGIRKE